MNERNKLITLNLSSNDNNNNNDEDDDGSNIKNDEGKKINYKEFVHH